jgi:hypothetical protein
MPTLRQKKAFKEITDNHRPVSTVMREVGYDDDTASKPSNLTNSKGWKELMEQYMPDSLLAKRHQELLNKRDEDGTPDTVAVTKALDMSYKLKGSYAPEKTSSLNLNIEARNISNPELEEVRERFINELKDKLK